MKEKLILLDQILISEEVVKKLKQIVDIEWIEKNELMEKIHDAKIIMSEFTRITRKEMDVAPVLKGIIVDGVGYDHIDVEEASKRGIYVVNLPGCNTESVAEFTISLILNLIKKTKLLDTFVRKGDWKFEETGKKPKEIIGKDLFGRTIGIIGLGQIGGRVAEIAKTFKMRILAYDPYVKPEYAKNLGAELVNLETLLKESDFVTIHSPLTKETRGMIGYKEFALMKPGSYLINTARGAIVDEKALVSALKEKRIAGAGLDVFVGEPISSNNPLLEFDNVITSPHIAGVTEEWIDASSKLILEEVTRIIKGEVPKNLVNRSLLIQHGYLHEK